VNNVTSQLSMLDV